MRTAIVATVRNEASRIGEFLASLEAQTRKPDVIVVTDGGSTDGTQKALSDFAARTALPFRCGAVPGNRSRGRNEAIRMAEADLIAVTDVSVPDPAWFERILEPLERGEADVVAGWYQLLVDTPRERAVGLLTQWSLSQVRPETFLPSSRSVAFTKAAWERVGGYPEDLATTEDTVFDLRLRDTGLRFVFEPRAVVRWRPATTVRSTYRMYRQFAISDGEARLFLVSQSRYGWLYLVYGGALALLVLGVLWPLGTVYAVAALILGGVVYLGYRIGKVIGARLWRQIPYAIGVALAMDVSRLVGYTRGRLHRRRGPVRT